MDLANYDNIIQLASNKIDRDKVKLILSELKEGEGLEVPDPYYGGEDGFENVFQMLDKSCEIIAKKITK